MFTLSLVAVSLQFAGCVGGVSTSANASPSPDAAKLSVTPNSVSVTASVGSSASQSVTASNTGTSALVINQVTVTGSGFTASGLQLPATLAGGAAKTFAIAFTPASPGIMTGSLALATNVSETPTVVALSATGVAAGTDPPPATPPPTTPPPTTPPPATPPAPVVTSVAVSPATASVAVNGTLSFTASVQGTATNTAVTWSATPGTISAAGVYTAPAKTGTATVTATSVADTTKSSSAKVTVTAAPVPVSAVSVTPASASVLTGATLQLSAAVQGTATNKSVTWKTSL
ncbi:MAG TPA: choice-of-anchor D domain-containing protein, partial [Candidatus Acidoferrum sp.]|nr:choice-of-anchor D domain-containing protein [Candidatus Acidoferrum sp.]